MEKTMPDGVWPTMVTPFTDADKVDYGALEELVEWYINAGVDGLFAVCQSSEMFFLSLEERVAIAEFVVKKTAGRVPVIASGHISATHEKQIDEMKKIADTGIDAAVLISNAFAKQDEGDDKWKKNLERFLDAFPKSVPLGIYECPYPYKRLVSPELLKWCADTGRFKFLKDTSCDPENIKAKIEAVKGSSLKIYNANAATLLESLKYGAAGLSGVMANFLPELIVWLCKNWDTYPQKAQVAQNLLGTVAPVQKRIYPICAKQYLQLEGVSIGLHTRSQDISQYMPSFYYEVKQMHSFLKSYKGDLKI